MKIVWVTAMRFYPFTFLLLMALILVGCQSGVTNISVSPDSDLGKQMLEMDAKSRAIQNASLFSQAMEAITGRLVLSLSPPHPTTVIICS